MPVLQVPAPSATTLPPLDNSLGVIVVAHMLVAVFYGATTVQTFIYHQRSQRDPNWLRFSVLFLWILDSVQFGFAVHVVYFFCVTNFANPPALDIIPSLSAYAITGCIGDLVVTGLFAQRLWKITSKIWLIWPIVIAEMASLAGVIALAVLSLKHPSSSYFNRIGRWTWYLSFIPQAISDVIIAVALTTSLLRMRTGFASTNSVIHLVVLYTVNTCLVTSAVGVTVVITYATEPGKLYYLGLAAMLPKLMLNSLLGMLNSREYLKDVVYRSSAEPVSIHLSRFPESSEPATQSLPVDHELREQESMVGRPISSDNQNLTMGF
ncbi:hypothetical protein BDW22DRAFT_716459 [Trametopsis cervina]|nr:hypothetical protein BDW22DRAFT_716459 [Trametopsis cervina]